MGANCCHSDDSAVAAELRVEMVSEPVTYVDREGNTVLWALYAEGDRLRLRVSRHDGAGMTEALTHVSAMRDGDNFDVTLLPQGWHSPLPVSEGRGGAEELLSTIAALCDHADPPVPHNIAEYTEKHFSRQAPYEERALSGVVRRLPTYLPAVLYCRLAWLCSVRNIVTMIPAPFRARHGTGIARLLRRIGELKAAYPDPMYREKVDAPGDAPVTAVGVLALAAPCADNRKSCGARADGTAGDRPRFTTAGAGNAIIPLPGGTLRGGGATQHYAALTRSTMVFSGPSVLQPRRQFVLHDRCATEPESHSRKLTTEQQAHLTARLTTHRRAEQVEAP